MRAVLTGGTGVIGRAAVTALIEAGHEVVVVARSAAECRAGRRARRGVPCAVTCSTSPASSEAFAGADCVVNLATSIPVGPQRPGARAWRRDDRLRTSGVANVVEAARRCGVRRLVQASASFLYAPQGDEWITEHSPVAITEMNEPTAVAESLVQDYTCDSRTGVVLRFGQIVGDDPQTRHLLRAAAAGRRIGIGRPDDWAHVVHVDDLGTAVLAALHAPSGVYNVGAEPVLRQDLVQGYAEAAGDRRRAVPRGGRSAAARRPGSSRWPGRCGSPPTTSRHRPAGARAGRPSTRAGWTPRPRGARSMPPPEDPPPRNGRRKASRPRRSSAGAASGSPRSSATCSPARPPTTSTRPPTSPRATGEAWLRRQVPPHHG